MAGTFRFTPFSLSFEKQPFPPDGFASTRWCGMIKSIENTTMAVILKKISRKYYFLDLHRNEGV